MALGFTSQEISRKYDRIARWYDWVEGVPDLLGLSKLRRRLLQGASDRGLEVAVGTGKNLRFFPRGSRVLALDLSREMLNVARKRAAELPINVSFLVADSGGFPFPSESFEHVCF